MRSLREFWYQAFLVERPSISLSLFRLAVAITVGCHMIPSLLELEDNYLFTAFKEKNGSFFPIWALRLVEQSPDWLVRWFVWLFGASWCCFLIGFKSQLSGILMGAACYYFYALNSLHIGTLSFDILLVTLSLIYATGYHGDWLSVDSVLRGDPLAYQRLRPFFIQRLLQLQIAWTFWYTALSKIAAGGNWLTDNPYYYLMHYPVIGVVREFPFREFLGQHPTFCYSLGLLLLGFELTLPLLWFVRKTRTVSVALGIAFQIMLLATLHVPTIFFFLFPPQMLLFVEPERLVAWLEARRARTAARGCATLLYDGRCGFCLVSVKRLLVLDCFGYLEPIDFHSVADVASLHAELTPEKCRSRMQLIEPTGRLSEGFAAFRRMSLRLPLLFSFIPLLYFPGAGWVGTRVYDWVARRRFVFHSSALCETNQCGVTLGEADSSSNT